jgi:hypothetical protein
MKNNTDNDLMSLKAYASEVEKSARDHLGELYRECPIPEDQQLNNLGMFLESKLLARILFLDFLYRQAVEVQGVLMEFGTHWGQNTAVFTALRGIYEPFNRHRKIIGFDTFNGFPSISKEDGTSDLMKIGKLKTSDDYPEYLNNLLQVHQDLNPLSHIQKNEIRVGDGSEQLQIYLKQEPHTIISLAYFDFDLYEPTKKCLELIRPRLVKGSVIGFDELNDPDSPGETLALLEVFGLNNVRLKRYGNASRVSYFVVE